MCLVWDKVVLLLAINTMSGSQMKIFILVSSCIMNMKFYKASDKATPQLLNWIMSCFSVFSTYKTLVHPKISYRLTFVSPANRISSIIIVVTTNSFPGFSRAPTSTQKFLYETCV